MSVAYELKQKRAALSERLKQLERELIDIQELVCALDRVILSYESDYQASVLTGREVRNRSRKAKPSSSAPQSGHERRKQAPSRLGNTARGRGYGASI
ncbi:hypothetical protein [Brucella tritici]|uniref:hypothetical protein n=1 Tax=Brucella tritici TaxID=94626 RepID=UPI0015927694|nr:hypothetical protein [Brucella tritici]